MIRAFDDLAEVPRWTAWRHELRGGKKTKIPYSPHGGLTKADDPSTWSCRAEAEATAKRIVDGLGGGIGIELGDLGADLYLGGFDLDSCVALDGAIAPWAETILSALPTYAERSPSGLGIKIFFYILASDVRAFLDLIEVQPGAWGCRRSVGDDGRDHGPAVEL
jgi:putative DNA primase/helicase